MAFLGEPEGGISGRDEIATAFDEWIYIGVDEGGISTISESPENKETVVAVQSSKEIFHC